MASANIQARLGDALVNFAENQAFPEEEEISAASLESSTLQPALTALNNAKIALEVGCNSSLY
jgi:hypothetical protein